jgi:hypothetical protein
VFWVFLVRNHVNRQNKTSHGESRIIYDDWSSIVFRRSLKTIQVEENSFQIPRHFKTEERSKKRRKLQNSERNYWLMRPCTWTMRPCVWGSLGYCLMTPSTSSHAPCACLTGRKWCLLVFKVGSVEIKSRFILLTPK